MASSETAQDMAEAIRGYLKSLEETGEPIPPPIGEEVVEVSIA